MEPVSDDKPARSTSFSHSLTSPSKHPHGPRQPSTEPPARSESLPVRIDQDSSMADAEFVPSGLLPPAAPRPRSSVPSPQPSAAHINQAAAGSDTDGHATTSPYFSAEPESSTTRYGSKHTTVVYPADEGKQEFEHVEHAPTGGQQPDKASSPMELDGPPEYGTPSGGRYDDKSADWAPDYRSPEAVPLSPESNAYQPAVESWGEGVPSGVGNWQEPAAYGEGSWEEGPPALISTADLPQVAQVGPGILPSALIEQPVWPIESNAWEIIVDNLPEPGPTPPPPPPRPLPPTAVPPTAELIPVEITLERSSTPSTSTPSPPEVLPAKIEPPTLQQVRDALPAVPSIGGAVLFCPTEMSWWVFPAGEGIPPEEMLTGSGAFAVARFASSLGETDTRKGRAGMTGDGLGNWDDTKKAPHLHLIRNAVRPVKIADEPTPSDPASALDSPSLGALDLPTVALPAQPGQDTEMDTSAPSTPANLSEGPSSSLVPTEPATPPPTTLPASSPADGDNLYISANDQTWVAIPRAPFCRGVLDPKDVVAFSRTRSVDPPAGVADGTDAAWSTILLMISNFLFKGQTQAIKITNPNFAQKVRWDETSQRILSQLGFEANTQKVENGPNSTVVAPKTDADNLRTMRARLLRAWVEISAYLEEHRETQRRHKNTIVPTGGAPQRHAGQIRLVKAEDGQFGDTTGLRSLLKRERWGWHTETYDSHLRTLGVNTQNFQLPASFVAFAYEAQVRFDAARTPVYLEAISHVAENWHGVGQDDLQTLVVTERSKGLFSQSEIDDAYEQIHGVSKATVEEIGVDRESLPHDYIAKAFREAHSALTDDGAGLSQKKKDLVQALEIIAVDRKADQEVYRQLAMVVEQAKRQPPSPEEAYRMLGIETEMDDEMVLVLYDIRTSDMPMKIYEWQDALRSIANARNSDTLRKFLDTGLRADANPAVEEPVSADRPVGLNNVGNTCYLNSLLQYFYTIRELRETVSNCSQFKEELKDDGDGESKRVGGRAVSKKEIERSIRFTDYLAGLFGSLEFSDTSSISPDLELAYLALVTSKDEEADGPTAAPVNAGTSDDTDATLVDEAVPPPAPTNSPLPISAPSDVELEPTAARTVLGKRTSEDRDLMDVDSRPESRSSTTIPEEVDTAMEGSDHSSQPSASPVPSPVVSPLSPGRKTLRQDSTLSASRSARAMTIEPEAAHPSAREAQVETVTEPNLPIGPVALPPDGPTKPPLPPRPVTKASADGPMMFGKQHDVSECLDNCLFQIEAAMDPLKLQSASEGGANLVKQLFYGKARQTLHFEGDLKASADHDKEVIFNHVLLNVGETGTTKDLYDGLSDYYTPELVDIDGKKASIEEVPVEFPRLLHVQLQRAQFDRETSRAYKSNAFLAFPESLRMDRYSEDADPEKREASRGKTTEIKDLRERVDALNNSGKQSFTESIATLSDDVFSSTGWLQSAHVDDELKKDLDSRRGEITTEILAAELDVKRLKHEVEAIWDGDNELEYELASVFMHRGDASFGHYYLYQRNLPNDPDSWFKYNDSFVTKVPASEVLADTTGTNANPYLLVYARKGLGLVDTVKRTLIV